MKKDTTSSNTNEGILFELIAYLVLSIIGFVILVYGFPPPPWEVIESITGG